MTRHHSHKLLSMAFAFIFGFLGYLAAQEKPQMAPPVNSPEVTADRHIIFRISAPKAESVGLSAGDIPGLVRGGPQFTKNERGVWEATIGPIDPGAYRYTFTVNGVSVVDPRNPSSSESNNNVWSLVYVPGAEFMDPNRAPHGAVAEVNYFSTALGRYRRMHIYTPPGYENNAIKYPVFYLLHGAMDCDDSWTSVGRAGFILDNLIATKKAKPMIVVMPAGHTSAGFSMGGGGGASGMLDEFGQDFMKDIMPYVESHYRLLPGSLNRAMAGLSMGGMQTLNIAIPNLDKFSYIGVFSSGLFGSGAKTPAAAAKTSPTAKSEPDPKQPQRTASIPIPALDPPAKPAPDWEQQHLDVLDNPNLKKGLKLLWFATGSEDFLVNTTKATIDTLKKHGFTPIYKETGGGHTWVNWRNYLLEFAPQLFQ
jgi:enterochelin esterase-like enzyme